MLESQAEGHVTLIEIASLIWRRKKLILALTVAGLIVTLVVIAKVPRLYEARMILGPQEQNIATSQLGSQASVGGTMKSLLTGGAHSAEEAQFVAMMQSVVVLERLDQRLDLRKRLFPEWWDGERDMWRTEAPSKLVRLYQDFRGMLNLPKRTTPTVWDSQKWVNKAFTAAWDVERKFWHVWVRDEDPEFALFILTALYEETQMLARERLIESLNRQIAYLDRRLAEVHVLDYRQMLLGMKADVERRFILVESGLPLQVSVIQPPRASTMLASPLMGLYIVVGLVISIVVSILLAAGVEFLQAKRLRLGGRSKTPLHDVEPMARTVENSRS